MTYLQNKKLTFMSIVNRIKGFVRSVSGIPPLSLSDCVDNDSLISYTIRGNTVQNGTPTPENPVEVESVGEKTKNLFNYADYTKLTNYQGNDITGNWLTIDNDLFYVKYDYYNGGCWLTPKKQWEISSGTYTLSGKCKDNTIKENPNICYCGVRWSDDTRNAGWGKINSNDGEWYNFSYTFTITEDKTVIGIYLQDNGATAKSSICFTNIQLEEGSTATEYEPYGYKIPVVCSGKNLFKIRTPDKTGQSAYVGYGVTSYKMNDDGSYTIYEYGAIGFNFNNLVAGEKYTVSCKFASTATMASAQYCFVGQNMYSGATGVKMARAYDVPNYIGKRLKLTFTADTTNLIAFAVGNCSDTTRVIITDIQLEKGDTRTDYEPYVEPVTTNIYLDEPLRKVGNYADYIDFENQKVVRNVGEVVFTGEENLNPILMTNAFVYVISNKQAGYSLSTHFINKSPLPTSTERYWGNIGISANSSSGLGFFNVNSPYTDTDSFKNYLREQYLNGTPVKVQYAYADSINQDIDLSELPAFKGTTVYAIDTTIQPSNMSATYYSTRKD